MWCTFLRDISSNFEMILFSSLMNFVETLNLSILRTILVFDSVAMAPSKSDCLPSMAYYIFSIFVSCQISCHGLESLLLVPLYLLSFVFTSDPRHHTEVALVNMQMMLPAIPATIASRCVLLNIVSSINRKTPATMPKNAPIKSPISKSSV